jgi:chromosome segregation ATPase
MNDATNDATDFESSLEGAIGFFQNLRRKLSALERDASAQHDRLRAVAASVADLDRERQSDRQTLAALAGSLDAQAAQLTELRANGRLLEEQFGTVEALIAHFQHDQEEFRQQSAALTGDSQRQQDRLKHLETLIGKVSADTNSTRQILNILQSDLITQSDTLRELDQHWQAMLAAYQNPPPQTSAAAPGEHPDSSDALPARSADEPVDQPPPLLAVPAERLDELLAEIAAAQREGRELRQILSDVQNVLTGQDQRFVELRSALQDQLHGQQEHLDRFETTLHHFERFRTPSDDVRNLEQQLSALEFVPQRLDALEEELIGRKQDLTQLHDAVRQLQEDSQRGGETLQQPDSGPLAGELEARLNEQRQQFLQLNEAIDGIRTDVKTTQEKVITMATNVAKRIFEFQNQLTATEAAHAERLREAEQKLIQLQAALELMETQRRERRWFSMPAMFTQILLTAGAAFLGVLVTVLWTTT